MTTSTYVLLLTLVVVADANPSGSRDHVIEQHQSAEVFVLVTLDRLVLLHHIHRLHRRPSGVGRNSVNGQKKQKLDESDPNVLLLIKHFKSDEQPLSTGARLTREMSGQEAHDDDSQRGNFLDFLLLPRRKRMRNPVNLATPPSAEKPPMLLSPPPPATEGKEKEISAGKSRDEELVDTVAIASDVMEYTGHVDTHEEDHGDFLTSLGGHIPHLWHDLGKMLTHSLGQNPLGTGTDRDSYEYFGMVGKAPYILCPLGFKKNSLGNTIYQPSSDVAPFCKNQHQ